MQILIRSVGHMCFLFVEQTFSMLYLIGQVKHELQKWTSVDIYGGRWIPESQFARIVKTVDLK